MADGPSRMLVWVTERDTKRFPRSGFVLAADGQFKDEVASCGSDLDQHEFGEVWSGHDLTGLLVFEGWVDVGPGEDPDVTLSGYFRRLDGWELCRLRFGQDPFGQQGLDAMEGK